MEVNELKKKANTLSEEIYKEAANFTKSLVGRSFKPVVMLLVRYVRTTNERLDQLEGK